MAHPLPEPPGHAMRRRTRHPFIWGLILALFALVTAVMFTVPIAIIQSLNQAHISNFAPQSPTGPAALDDENLAGKAGYNASLLPILLVRAQAGDRSAMYFYGDIFDPNDFGNETAVPKDAATANAWYRRAVALDDQGAERNLAINYYFGTGMPEDNKIAASLFERAAAKNDDFGDYYLGLMLQNGEGEPADLPRAVALEQASAAQGQALGEVQLGLMYYAGIGVPQNLSKAQAEWDLAGAQHNWDAHRISVQTQPYFPNVAKQWQDEAAECGIFGSTLPSAALVTEAYNCVVAGYDPTKPAGNSVFRDMTRTLENAGVKILLTSSGGMTVTERVAILNDYGLWSYKWLVNNGRPTYKRNCSCLKYGPDPTPDDYVQAESVLKLAVQLAPSNADAWLNLGNVYASMLNPKFAGPDANATWAGKQELTKDALTAYKHYIALTPKPTQYIRNFMALNDTNAPRRNVCRFVRTFANENRLDETFAFTSDVHGSPVNFFGNGKSYYVYMGAPQPVTGSKPIWGRYHFIAADASPQIVNDSELSDTIPQQAGSVNFKPLGLSNKPPYFDDIRLMVFHNRYYVLAIDYFDPKGLSPAPQPPYAATPAALVEIIQPNHGIICRMRARGAMHHLQYDNTIK